MKSLLPDDVLTHKPVEKVPVPDEIIRTFMERYDFVSEYAVKNNIKLMLEGKPVVAMATWIDLGGGEFVSHTQLYNSIYNPMPAEEPCQVWIKRMADSVLWDKQTFVMPFETNEEAQATADRLNKVLLEAARQAGRGFPMSVEYALPGELEAHLSESEGAA